MDTIFSHPLAFAVIVLLPLFGIAAKAFGVSFRKIAKWYLYISVFCVVVVMDSIFFPFIGGKDWFFRFAVELSAHRRALCGGHLRRRPAKSSSLSSPLSRSRS